VDKGWLKNQLVYLEVNKKDLKSSAEIHKRIDILERSVNDLNEILKVILEDLLEKK